MIRRQRSAHAWIWTVLSVALSLAVLLILANAPGPRLERPPVRLDMPEAAR